LNSPSENNAVPQLEEKKRENIDIVGADQRASLITHAKISETLRRRSLNDKDILLDWGESEAKGNRQSQIAHKLFE